MRTLKLVHRTGAAWLSASAVFAQNETPASARAADFEPYQWHLPQPAGFIAAAVNQNYDRVYYGNTTATLNPSPKMEDLQQEYASNSIGVLFQESHGSASGFAVEAYPLTPAGLAQRDARFTTLDAQGTYHGRIYKSLSDAGYHISVFYLGGVSEWFSGPKTLIYSIICCSAGFEGWGPKGARAWYDCSSDCGTYVANADTFWARMDGQQSVARRRSGNARDGLSGLDYGGNENTTLGPVVQVFGPGQRVPPEGVDVTWTFDSTTQGLMLPASYLVEVFGNGTLSVTNVNWLTNTTLGAHLSAATGSPILRLRGDLVASENLTNAHLDGNTNPAPPQFMPPINGRGPGGDHYDVTIRTTITERAAVGNFRVVDEIARWEVGAEYLTAGYVVEGAQNVDGPWVQIGPTLSAGLGPRSVDVSGSGYPLIRVVEEETSGFRREGPIEASTSPPPPPQGLPSYATLIAELDSLEQVRLSSGPHAQALGPRCIIFTPSRFRNVVQTQVADYWRNWHGYQTALVLTDQYPQPPNHEGFRSTLQAAIRSYAAAGVRYFHLIGDWSDWREFTDPTIYPALWHDAAWGLTRQDWVTRYNIQQDEHDIIPAFIIPDTIRSQNMDYVRPYDYTDLPYADTNDDGVPDVVVTRWPFADSVAVAALAFKMQSYNDLPTYLGVGPRLLLTVDDESVPPRVLGDSIVADVAPVATVMRIDAKPDVVGFRSRVASAWNGDRPELVVSVAAWSDEWNPCMAFRDFPEAATSYVTPPIIAGSCSASRWADPPARGPYPFERILTAENPTRGAVVWLGPSSSSWAEGNGLVVRYSVQEIFANLNRPLAESWLAGMQRVFTEFSNQPDIVKAARTYAFLGDPLTKLRHYPIPTDVAELREEGPFHLSLRQNWPNPFNPTTQLLFITQRKGHVRLRIYNVRGQLVRTVVDATLPAGRHRVQWTGTNEAGERVSSGVYVCRMDAEGRSFTRKLTILR